MDHEVFGKVRCTTRGQVSDMLAGWEDLGLGRG